MTRASDSPSTSLLSIKAALSCIAEHMPLGWDEMAMIVDREVRTVRGWGDLDQEECVPLDAAMLLDFAYLASGGEGAPLYQAYTDWLNGEGVNPIFGIQQGRNALQRHTVDVICQSSAAHVALVLACQPDATPDHFNETRRDVEDAIAALEQVLPMLGEPP